MRADGQHLRLTRHTCISDSYYLNTLVTLMLNVTLLLYQSCLLFYIQDSKCLPKEEKTKTFST